MRRFSVITARSGVLLVDYLRLQLGGNLVIVELSHNVFMDTWKNYLDDRLRNLNTRAQGSPSFSSMVIQLWYIQITGIWFLCPSICVVGPLERHCEPL